MHKRWIHISSLNKKAIKSYLTRQNNHFFPSSELGPWVLESSYQDDNITRENWIRKNIEGEIVLSVEIGIRDDNIYHNEVVSWSIDQARTKYFNYKKKNAGYVEVIT